MSARPRTLAAAALLAALALALVLALHRTPSSSPSGPSPASSPQTTALSTSPRPTTPAAAETPSEAPIAPVDHTVRDRALRDRVRRQIWRAWSGESEPSPSAPRPPDPTYAPMPERDGGGVDPDYLRARIREDFVPMATVCFEQFESRVPGVAGAVVTDFVIVGDEHVGGVVDEVTLQGREADAAVFGDAEFQTCMRESMMAMVFRPPPRGGRLRVRYPFRFAPGDAGSFDASAR